MHTQTLFMDSAADVACWSSPRIASCCALCHQLHQSILTALRAAMCCWLQRPAVHGPAPGFLQAPPKQVDRSQLCAFICTLRLVVRQLRVATQVPGCGALACDVLIMHGFVVLHQLYSSVACKFCSCCLRASCEQQGMVWIRIAEQVVDTPAQLGATRVISVRLLWPLLGTAAAAERKPCEIGRAHV